jgi:hypothetical protein
MTRTLRDSLTSRDKIDEIILSLNSDIGRNIVFILVEGIDDCRVYPKFFDPEKTNIEFIPGGKDQLVTALSELNQLTRKIIGIVDADFNHLQNISPSISNLFFTDFHDIEMTMLSVDGVLDDVLVECRYAENAQKVFEKVLLEAEKLAYIRWFNEINKTKLHFEGLGIGNFTNSRDTVFPINSNKYLDTLNKRSKNKTKEVGVADIAQFREAYYTRDLFNLCNGHDVTALIALIIGTSVSHEKFCSNLRSVFSMYYFCKTKLCAELLKWQEIYGIIVLRNMN